MKRLLLILAAAATCTSAALVYAKLDGEDLGRSTQMRSKSGLKANLQGCQEAHGLGGETQQSFFGPHRFFSLLRRWTR